MYVDSYVSCERSFLSFFIVCVEYLYPLSHSSWAISYVVSQQYIIQFADDMEPLNPIHYALRVVH